jgi:multiple sugar transport system substrate-binding protein
VVEVYVAEIEISVNSIYADDPQGVQFQPLLAEFKRQHRAHVSLQVYDWGFAWAEFMKISLYGHGPVISQTGDSWMGSLIARNSLRAFKDRELAQLGRQKNFLPDSWQSCLDFNNKDIVAIPWFLDTYLVYYHRDLLEKAGVNEATAFSTLESFHATLEKLQESGLSYPFAIPTNASHSNIHVVASWVWGQGGDFTNPEGTRVSFTEPKTREGMGRYFDLFRFMPRETQPLSDQDCWDLFLNRKIAVTVRNPALLFRLKKQEFSESFSRNVAAAVLPGVPLLGGSHLVIWNHIRPEQEQDAIDLIKFLTSTNTELSLFESTGLIPASLDALNHIDPASIFAPAIQSVKKGRAFHRIRLWGLIEDKLVNAMAQTWKTLFSASNPDVDQVIADHLNPMEDKLNITLSQ